MIHDLVLSIGNNNKASYKTEVASLLLVSTDSVFLLKFHNYLAIGNFYMILPWRSTNNLSSCHFAESGLILQLRYS